MPDQNKFHQKNIIHRLFHYFLSESVPMRSKQFDLIILYLVPTLLVMSLALAIIGQYEELAILALIFSFALIIIWYLTHHYFSVKKASNMLCILINFFVVPIFFFSAGGIYSGIPLIFVEGIIITCFLIDGTWLTIYLIFEILFDCYIIMFSHFHPEMMTGSDSRLITYISVAAFFIDASCITIFIMGYQSWIHQKTSENIARSKIEVENARQAKSRFLANMTHEIRTPMNAIVGMTELILKEEMSDGAREETEVVREASSELLTIINNILSYSKLDSGKLELLPTKYRFDQLMNEIIQTVSVELQGRNIDFHVNIDPTVPIMLYGDDIRIKQVFLSLLFNSLRYSDDGRIIMEVRKEYLKKEHSVRLHCRVSDTGIGLSQVEIDAIFGAYERYDSRQGSNMKGMGLELSICKELLKLMGGELKISSIVGIGMAIDFEFTNAIVDDIPIVRIKEDEQRHVLIYVSSTMEEKSWKILNDNFNIRPEYVSSHNAFSTKICERKYSHIFLQDSAYQSLKDVLEQYDCEDYTYIITDYKHVFKDFNRCKLLRRPLSCLNLGDVFNDKWVQEQYQAPMEKENVEFPKAKVLLVDDNMVNLKIAAGLLENFKIKADSVQSGADCIEMLRKEKYHLVLLDQFMPEMNGIETLKSIRRIPGEYYKELPVLCMTADFGGEVREHLISEGFQDYIAKPIKIYYLERFLRKYLPEELMVLVKKEASQEPAKQQEVPAEDKESLSLQPAAGIMTVGGNEETYLAILNTYYKEGLDKIKEIPDIYERGDIQLFTTNVHSVKGSSASVGAPGISGVFKALEMAGKSQDIEYIESHLHQALEQFGVLLEEVRVYLYEKGALEADIDADGNENTGEEEKLRRDDIMKLKEALDQINLKLCEELIGELTAHNYGKKNNHSLAAIKTSYQMFDYHKVKELIQELLQEMA
ncbi:MAG: response regulator [bacterium]|nr:response regulator [bacterium]